MRRQSLPTSLSKYLAEDLPKQDTETLCDVQTYVDALTENQTQPLNEDKLPETAEPIKEPDKSEKGTVVKESQMR